VSEPAWKSKQSWYLVATDDRMIPPAAQRFMAQRAGAKLVENAGSHAIYVSTTRRGYGKARAAILATIWRNAAAGGDHFHTIARILYRQA
jgi:hypothetical protein